MSRATSRTNIKILALPPDGDAQEEKAKNMDKKNAKRNAEGKKPKNTSNKKDKDKKIPTTDGIFTKNIVFKEVLTP
jgi:ATP-dependent DNA helicase PIF1